MTSSAEHQPGQPERIIGRYALYGDIAAGGMATVHIGRLLGPVGFARTVAIKRLHPQFARDPEFVSMFLDEARLAARVQHPNVVATIDVVATGGELFLIMDYVRGEPLSRLVRLASKHNERVPPRVVSSIICGFLHGLHSAHEAKNERGEPLGMIHRDVSPQNVLVGTDGIARVLDFGVAKAAGRVQVTRDGQIKGKLAYMPPDQLHGRELTRAVDIYASAVVLWESLTGERLFKGETEADTLKRILRGNVELPSTIVPRLPTTFDDIVLRGLGKMEPYFATAREMAMALEKCAGIASPTEVGEWVERIAGDVLAKREEHLAEIESESTGLSAPDDSSTSDLSVAMPPEGLPLPFRPGDSRRQSRPDDIDDGVDKTVIGPPSQHDLQVHHDGAGVSSVSSSAPYSSRSRMNAANALGATVGSIASKRGAHAAPQHLWSANRAPGSDPPSKSERPSMSVSESVVIPGIGRPRRPMPLLAVGAALVATFLAGGVAMGIYGHEEKPSAAAEPSASSSASHVPFGATPVAVTTSASNEPAKLPAADTALPLPVAAVTARPPPRVTPALSPNAIGATPGATAPPKRPAPNCEPPYEIDEKGHKKYKLDCLK